MNGLLNFIKGNFENGTRSGNSTWAEAMVFSTIGLRVNGVMMLQTAKVS